MAKRQIDKLSYSESTALAGLCKAASDPLRLDIVRLLSRESFGVQELASIFAMPQPGMSHHLKVLTTAGLLSSRRQGNSIFYRRTLVGADTSFSSLIENLFHQIDSLALGDDIVQRAQTIHAERAQQSRQFFEKNADKFAEQQGMLCELTQYRTNLLDMLNILNLPENCRALEVGPGQGELLSDLSQRFKQVVALEASEEMLSIARNNSLKEKQNIEFVCQSLESVNGMTASFDAIVLNMVLHHMPSPAEAMRKLFELTADKGYVIICDLCSHDQEWTKLSCGDLWQGFDPEELINWAEAAGFEKRQSQFLGLKNGFQIQLMLFQK